MNTRGRRASARVQGGAAVGVCTAAPSVRQRLGKPYRNKKHLAYVASQPCMVCGAPAEVHHLLKPWRGLRGSGRRAGDENTVPLCPSDHGPGYAGSVHHNGDEEAWAFAHFGHVAALRAEAERLWLASPHYELLEVRES